MDRDIGGKFLFLDPELLKLLLILGAFSEKEAKRKGLTREILEGLRRIGILKLQGKIYEINTPRVEELLEQYEKLKVVLSGTKKVPVIGISKKKKAKLGQIGIKNIHIIYFHPHQGPTLLCSMRYTKLARLLMERTDLPVTLSTISKRAEEIKMAGERLILRVFTTRYHGRELYHIIAAEVTDEFDYNKTIRLLGEVCRRMTGQTIGIDKIRKAIEKATV